ncbi:MAG: ATP-binding protein [Nannocystales bacterium]
MDAADELQALRAQLAEREAQLAERESEVSILRAAIRASPAGILVASAPDGVIEEWNAAALGIRGSGSDELTKIPIELHPTRWQTFHPNGDVYNPEDLPLSRALLRGEVVNGDDVIIRDEDGNERWVIGHAAPVYDDEGELVAGVVVFPDVTERKNAELRAARFRRMSELSPDFVGLWHIDGAPEYINPAGRALCGLSKDADTSPHLADVFTKASAREVLEDGVPSAIEHGHWRAEVELRGPGDTVIPVSQALMAHRDADGKCRYLSAVMRDLRPMRDLESQLRRSQRLESIGRLAGGIAHDFNNLLTIIDNYARLVRDSLDSVDERRDDLAQIGLASDRGAALCTQLLSFARQQIIRPTTLHISGVVQELVKLFHRTLGEDILVDIQLDPELWSIKVDRSQLDQILLNLVVNARDAMPNGGTLSLEAQNIVLDEHYASTRADVVAGEYVMIAVSDTGVGMPPETQERVFEPFFTTKGHSGNGLGLATVFGAVRQNGGHIWVYSEEGTGTCFKIYWPRSKARGATKSQTQDSAPARTGGTILVVEDEPLLLRLTTRLLKKGGYTVLAAEDGPTALKLARGHDGKIELLLTDVVMPHMTGKQLAETLSQERPETRVLYVSGYTQNTIVHGGVLDKGVAFLEKPFSLDSLLARISSLLSDD